MAKKTLSTLDRLPDNRIAPQSPSPSKPLLRDGQALPQLPAGAKVRKTTQSIPRT